MKVYNISIKLLQRAVDLDDLSTVDDLVRYTNSAVDVRTVLGQIRTFWRQLGWPDPETSYVFISRILDDACRAAVFYAERMGEKAEEEEENEEEELFDDSGGEDVDEDKKRTKKKTPRRDKDEEEIVHFTRGQCLAVNNIDFVLKVRETKCLLNYMYVTRGVLNFPS